jgi:2,4-dienoyl-CoA reductase-like NADH-dependent reductase (Old Yellow Enzyme family)/pyruvate/2-oxoglutarate dehydrogenase complex dihydrolipoamide dehydrogenase (E3) component
MSKPAYPHLFQPLQLRHKTLKHRLNFGAHTANMSIDGLPAERHLGYYRERARGGAAMIVVEPAPVHKAGKLTRGNFRAEDDSVIPGFRRITDACHEHGTVMIHQMYHVGAHGDWDNSFEAAWSPSGLPSMHDSDGSHRMSEAEIAELVECFGQAARRDHESGFDGSEIMAAYNALLEQFWSPYSNRRTDRYGGSFENRMRFSTEVLTRMRQLAGEEFILGMAISVDITRPEILSIADQQEILAWHDERGLYDYVSCGTGSYYDFTKIIPTFVYEDKLGAPFSEALKQVAKHVRVQAESHIRTPENADYVIASGAADMVSIVRGQIADPHMANKAEAGRSEDIRPCISCNQMCWGRRSRDYWISCLVNPSVGREYQWDGDTFAPAKAVKRVLVVGGGPAGMEAARVAAERGHQVTLAEASDKLGGQFRLAGLQPRRAQILDLIHWYEGQLEKLQVRVQLNTPMDAAEIREFGADAVVIATGSSPTGTGFQRALPDLASLPGAEMENVFAVEDVMRRDAKLGKRVLLLDDGGNWRGSGTAWHMAEKGHQVTIVTPDPFVGREIVRTAADLPLRMRLAKLGAKWITESAVTAWHGDGATIRNLLDGSEQRQSFDTLVLATVNQAETGVADELQAVGVAFKAVGDCLAPRHTPAATFEGRRLGLEI